MVTTHVSTYFLADWVREKQVVTLEEAVRKLTFVPVDQVRWHEAQFRDLLGLPARSLQLHAFERDGDALVAISPLIGPSKAKFLA